jgi:predicted ATPase
MRYLFGNCELDLDQVRLRVDGVDRPVEPQVFNVIALLVQHRNRVISKEEILDAVWNHRFVSESSLTSRIKSARQAIGDDGQAQRLIRTVHGMGYQFVGEVRTSEPAMARSGTPVPLPATPTIGRNGDIDRILGILERARVVTLLGTGGVGKTRVALEVALRWTASDACFVDLTKVREPELVPGLIARELGAQNTSAADDRQVLAEALRGRPATLLVLDNFEHVIEAADTVTAMIQWAPELKVLATSRARLQIVGEHVFDIAPLSVETSERDGDGVADAVALFEQAATAIDRSFELGPNLADVVAICRTVDGLPLAVELAASHVRTLPPPLLRTRLSAQLGTAANAARDLPGRQRTITATIDWSLQLLGQAQRELFVQLGVFSGPASLEMIETVVELPAGTSAVDALSNLVDQSMVRRVTGLAGSARFVLLELLRERARELLGERTDAEAVARRHAEQVAALCDDVDERKWIDLSDRWIDVMAELLGEIRAAYHWARKNHERLLAARIVASLGTYWHRSGYDREAREWVASTLAEAGSFDPLLNARIELAGGLAEWDRDLLAARVHLEKAASSFRALQHRRHLAFSLTMAAGTHISDRDGYISAMAQCDEAIELARKVGEKPLIAQALNVKGELARVCGDDDTARAAYEEGRDLAESAGDRAHLSILLADLGYLAEHRGEHAEAHRLTREGLRLCLSLGRRMVAACLVSHLAGPEVAMGRPERGALLVGASDQALQVIGVARYPGCLPEHARAVESLEATLGPDEFHRLHAEGARLSLEDAIRLAFADMDTAESLQGMPDPPLAPPEDVR